jgi:hypothetical protein
MLTKGMGDAQAPTNAAGVKDYFVTKIDHLQVCSTSNASPLRTPALR